LRLEQHPFFPAKFKTNPDRRRRRESLPGGTSAGNSAHQDVIGAHEVMAAIPALELALHQTALIALGRRFGDEVDPQPQGVADGGDVVEHFGAMMLVPFAGLDFENFEDDVAGVKEQRRERAPASKLEIGSIDLCRQAACFGDFDGARDVRCDR